MGKTWNENRGKIKKQFTIGKLITGISIIHCFFGGKHGGIKKRIKWSIFVFAAIIMLSVRPSNAFLGFGDIVFDPGNLIQSILNGMQQITSAANSVNQTANQLKSLQYQVQNLAKMDPSSAASTLSNLQGRLATLMQIQASLRGITMNYAQVQGAWDQLYGADFGRYNGMKGSDYAAQALKILKQTDNATYDAMRAQGMVSELANDAANLESLLTASNSSGGALSAAQAGNAIAAIQAQQLMRLQQIVATSYRAESSYYADQANRAAMSRANSDKFFSSTIQRPLQGFGNGKATMQIK